MIRLILALVLLAPLAAFASGNIIIGTAGTTGVYFPTGGAICRLMNRGYATHGYHCAAESTGGSLANLEALRAGKLQFAVVQSDWLYQAYHGTGAFSGKAFPELRAVLSLYNEPYTFLVRADSRFHTLEDIRTARVNLGPIGSGPRAIMEQFFTQLGWDTKTLTQRGEIAWPDQAKALCAGQMDAIFFIVGHPNAMVQDAMSQCDLRLLPITGASAERLLATGPFYTRAVIPAGMYPGNEADVPTVGVQAVLVTKDSVEDAAVTTLVKALFENLGDFKTLHPVFAHLNAAHMVAINTRIPLHPAAERYYEATKRLPAK